jgi:hypothetical protein
VTAQFAFYVLFGAVAVGTGHKKLGAGAGLLATFGSIVVTLVAALAVNDWLARRYPLPERQLEQPRSER